MNAKFDGTRNQSIGLVYSSHGMVLSIVYYSPLGSFLIILALKLSWRFTITVTLY